MGYGYKVNRGGSPTAVSGSFTANKSTMFNSGTNTWTVAIPELIGRKKFVLYAARLKPSNMSSTYTDTFLACVVWLNDRYVHTSAYGDGGSTQNELESGAGNIAFDPSTGTLSVKSGISLISDLTYSYRSIE